MNDDISRLPIALRRTPRQGATRLHASTSPSQRHPRKQAVSKSPGTPRQARTVRPSNSRSIIVRDIDAGPTTPLVKQPRQKAIPTNRRRKNMRTPSSHTTNDNDQAVKFSGYDIYGVTPACHEVRILPLRAILDDRVKRRIRRNGLSEEMNNVYGERKEQAQKTVKELQSLREQVAAKELENNMLREQSSLLQDTSRIQELEREISELRHGLCDTFHNVIDDDWDMAAADGFTDDGSFSEMDSHFRDDTTLEVESADSLPQQKEKPYIDTLAALTPPNTSPTKSTSPCNSSPFFTASHCDVGVQAKFADSGHVALETELTQLRCEILCLKAALETKDQIGCEINVQTATLEDISAAADVDPDIQLQTDIMLQTLAEKTAALDDLNSLISSLGSSGSDASEIVSKLRFAFQSARQELEQIFPDDKSLSTSLDATIILNCLRQHLLESVAQAKKYEALLRDHCVQEQYLLGQLNDRMVALDTMRSKLREKDNRIFMLEADVDRSETIFDEYEQSLAKEKQAVEQRDVEMADVKANFKLMVSVAAELQAQLDEAQVEREVEAAASSSTYDRELTIRDVKILELHEDITALKTALTEARDSVSSLQGDNDRDKKAARDTVAALRTQLLQSLQMSEAFLT